MDKRTQIVLAAARNVVAAAARHPETDLRDPIQLEASLIALSFAVRALDRAEPATSPEVPEADPPGQSIARAKSREMPALIAALEAGKTLEEAFAEATGRPLDLRRPGRRLRDCDLTGRGCPDERHS